MGLACSAAAQTAQPTSAPSAASSVSAPAPASGEGSTAPATTPAIKKTTTISKKSSATAQAKAGKSSASHGKASKAAAGASKTTAGSDSKGGSPFQALSFGSGHGPIDIHSETLALDYKAHKVVYQGNVRATQGTASLNCDNLEVLYNNDFKDLKQAVCTGNVRVAQGGRWATGQRADFNQTNHTVVMTGNPIVHDGPDQVTGTRILIYLDSDKSVVEQAHAVIFPRKGDENDNQKPNDQASNDQKPNDQKPNDQNLKR
jgi:lipopolysaccharide export system protein LptA